MAIGTALDEVDIGNRCGIRVTGGVGDGWLGGWGWLGLGLGMHMLVASVWGKDSGGSWGWGGDELGLGWG